MPRIICPCDNGDIDNCPRHSPATCKPVVSAIPALPVRAHYAGSDPVDNSLGQHNRQTYVSNPALKPSPRPGKAIPIADGEIATDAKQAHVYILHFDAKIGDPLRAKAWAQHTIGVSTDLPVALERMAEDPQTAIMRAVRDVYGYGFTLALCETYESPEAAQARARTIQRIGQVPTRHCGICKAERKEAKRIARFARYGQSA